MSLMCYLFSQSKRSQNKILERKQVKAIVRFGFVSIPPPSFSGFILIHGIAM